jgi:hypothetical protein
VAKNTSGLKRGGPGRPKGLPNKATREMKAWASGLFESDEWRASARRRIIEGKAPHLEAHCLQVLMPKTEKTDITSNGEAIKTILNNYVAPAPDAPTR